MSEKDRHLSKTDYLDQLQREYYINELKSKIYSHYKDREYYQKVMKYKKEKILGISNKLGQVVNIFNDKETEEFYKKQIYPSKGLPDFPLTEEEIEKYYSIDSEVIITLENGKRVTGKISYSIIKKNITHVKIRGEQNEKVVHLSNVTRIF